MRQSYGWSKDPFDKQDYLHRRMAIVLPDRVSHAQLLTPVRDQGTVGSCVGHGIGINLNSIKMALGIYTEWCSPTFLYNGARYIEGTLPIDCGCHPRDALDWTVDYGILLEHFWPYDSTQIDKTAPSSERITQANRYKGLQYWRAIDGIDGLCDALIEHFVSIGTPWFREWEDPKCGNLSIPTNSSFESGGHETCLYAYDRTLGLFYGINSWGTDWGNKGLYAMPFEAVAVFKDRGGYDAHYITFTKDIDNTPIPVPMPSPCPWGNRAVDFLNAIQVLRRREGRFYYGNPR